METIAIVLSVGTDQVEALIADASDADVQVAYREVTTIKGHDAFLIEWDQLSAILVEALDDGTARSAHQREVLALPA